MADETVATREHNHEHLRIHPNATVESILGEIASFAGLIGFTLQDIGTQPEKTIGAMMLVAEEIEARAVVLQRMLPIQIINFAPAQDVIDFNTLSIGKKPEGGQ